MKIIQSTYLNLPMRYPQSLNHRQNNSGSDVFVSSTRSLPVPSFRANSQNIYKKILESPTLSQKFMGLVSAAAASLIAVAHFGDEEKKNSEVLDLQNILQGAAKEACDDTDVQLKKELEEYKEENLKLRQKLKELENQVNVSDTSEKQNNADFSLQQEDIIIEEKKDNLYHFEFPKKRGKLSALQVKLKESANNLLLSETSIEQLKFICQQALQKGVLDSNKLDEFSDKLASDENKELIIQTFFESISTAPTTNDVSLTTEHAEIEQKDEEDILKKMGIKVVGRIDTDKLQTRGKDDISLFPITTEDSKEQPFMFKVRLASHQSMVRTISKLMSRFQKQIYSDYKTKEKLDKMDDVGVKSPKWKYNKRIPEHVQPEDIAREIAKVNATYNQFGSTKYQHIVNVSPEEIANIINTDTRYRALFTIHGALRFLDRYVDFDSNEDIEVQSLKNLDALFNTIQQCIKSGIVVDSYISEGYYAPRMNISSESFDENARKIFGDQDLCITFAEAQATSRYIPSPDKNGLICTIYSK